MCYSRTAGGRVRDLEGAKFVLRLIAINLQLTATVQPITFVFLNENLSFLDRFIQQIPL